MPSKYKRVTPRTLEFRVLYRRDGDEYRHQRILQARPFVERYVARLRRGTRRDLAPLVELVVQQRKVGPWADIEELEP